MRPLFLRSRGPIVSEIEIGCLALVFAALVAVPTALITSLIWWLCV
jgi:hypothetical protein